jgi:ferredoxin
VVELPERDGTALVDCLEHALVEAGVRAQEAADARPRVALRLLHPPAQERVQLDREERCLVTPVLEHLPASPQPLRQGFARVRAEAGEEGQLVRAGEHVHRVDLHQADPLQDPTEVPPIDPTLRTGVVEALRLQGDAAGFRAAEGVIGQGHRLCRVGSESGIPTRSAPPRRYSMRVVVDFDLCESNALCMAAAPEVFEVRDDDFLYILQEEPGEELRAKVEEAARRCPKQAIVIEG